jgi:hypothetical protein
MRMETVKCITGTTKLENIIARYTFMFSKENTSESLTIINILQPLQIKYILHSVRSFT